jgi:hypothetical protein
MIPEAPDAHPGLRGEGLNCKLAEKIRTSNIQRPTSNFKVRCLHFLLLRNDRLRGLVAGNPR